MRNRLSRACLALLFLLPRVALAQDEEFAQTPPPKVLPAVEASPAGESSSDSPAVDVAPDPYMEKLREIMAEEESAPPPTADDAAAADQAPPGTVGDGGIPLAPAFLKGMMALCATLALFLLSLAALKRWGRRTPLLAGHGLGTVMGRVALSPQASLHFVRIKNEVLVVGVTQQSVNLIRTMEAELFDDEEERAPEPLVKGAEPIDFLSQLQASQANLQRESAGFDEELDSLKGDLQRLKQYFQDSARARE